VVGHGDYSSTGNCWDKATQVFRTVFELSSGISEILFMVWKHWSRSTARPMKRLFSGDILTMQGVSEVKVSILGGNCISQCEKMFIIASA
jgi:hypothetical protein